MPRTVSLVETPFMRPSFLFAGFLALAGGVLGQLGLAAAGQQRPHPPGPRDHARDGPL